MRDKINPKLNVCYKSGWPESETRYFFVIRFIPCDYLDKSSYPCPKCKGRLVTFPPQELSCFRSTGRLRIEEVTDEDKP